MCSLNEPSVNLICPFNTINYNVNTQDYQQQAPIKTHQIMMLWMFIMCKKYWHDKSSWLPHSSSRNTCETKVHLAWWRLVKISWGKLYSFLLQTLKGQVEVLFSVLNSVQISITIFHNFQLISCAAVLLSKLNQIKAN